MKKFLTLLVAVMLLAMLPVYAFAAGSASVSGPDVVRAGDTITVRFQAGGGIYGGNGSVSFDSNQLTLQSYSASLSAPWAVEFAGNSFVFYDNSMAAPISGTQTIFTATFQVSASLEPGTNVSVSFNGITLSDGQSDTGVGTKTYSVTIAEPLSNNANLKSLTVSNAEISPAFSADTTIHYSAGDDSEWAYGNQQKEFPGDEHCYVRIGCIPISDIKEGIDAEIVVTYRFTFSGSCSVELSDGIATRVEGTEAGVIEYTRTLRAMKEGDTKEDLVIFQYSPDGEGSITLEVIYDDQVDDRYDVRNTVYFSGKAADVEAGIH